MGVCPHGGGARFTLAKPHSAFLCCANHYGDASSPVSGGGKRSMASATTPDPGQTWTWEHVDGGKKYGVSADGMPHSPPDPCTFFKLKLEAGDHVLCCHDSWASGVFLGAP
jgi:hypothetical protein